MQACHGKAAPLRRLRADDRVAYYSPTERFRGGDRLQCFTAYGRVDEAEIQQVDMGAGFRPFRRRVTWLASRLTPVQPLREDPGFALSGAGWGARLRFGLVEIDAASMDAIAAAMGSPERC
jgi:hypothetical protein